jgi:hypothetical protein
MYVSGKMRSVETITGIVSGMGGGEIKENDGGW